MAKGLWRQGVPSQAYHLGERILEVKRLVTQRQDLDLREVHPEVSFAAMNELRPVPLGKKSFGGVERRRALLSKHGIKFTGKSLGEVSAVEIHDVLDAAAAAWSADQIARKQWRSLPKDPPRQHGRPVAIWY